MTINIGKHRVLPIQRYKQIIAYAKAYPESPGYEKTVNLLAKKIFPNSCARNEFFRFTVNRNAAASTPVSYSVLLSQPVKGDLLKAFYHTFA